MARQYTADQRLDVKNDVRKGVNVLNTSNPQNPAPNPFVQNQPVQAPPQTPTSTQSGTTTQTGNGSKK